MKDGVLTPHAVYAESIPEAHYKAIETVWKCGADKRTQYDRKDLHDGSYIDPTGKDAQLFIHVRNPFSQPRYPLVSACERGKYILEILGVKNHLVVPREELLRNFDEGKDTRWPYAYSQRLIESPVEGGTINQVETAIQRIVDNIDTRRAAMTTRVPEIDTKLKEDIPCLGEVYFRGFEIVEGGKKKYVINMTTSWRSRDHKAWADNVLGLTYWGRKVAEEIGRRTGIETVLGGYTELVNSFHIYGQDLMLRFTGDGQEKKSFFEVFPDVGSYVARAVDSETTRDLEILPQMKELLGEAEQWKFSEDNLQLIKREIGLLENGLLP